MQALITGINQEVSFEDGSVTNYITVKLADGSSFRALITDETTAMLVQKRAQGGGIQAPRMPAPPAPQQQAYVYNGAGEAAALAPQEQIADPMMMGGDDAVVFGGDAQSPNTPPSVFMPGGPPQQQDVPPELAAVLQGNGRHEPDPDLSSNDPQIQAAAYRRQQQAQKQRNKQGPTIGRTVPKDANGYPVLRNGGTNVEDVVGGSSGGMADEDGVGQF